jgi:hypothetical protein
MWLGIGVILKPRWPIDFISRWDNRTVFWSAGVIVFGIALRILALFNPSKAPDALFSIAWATSISTAIAWLWIIGLGFFSMGMFWDMPGFFAGILSAGFVGGWFFGFRAYRRNRARLTAMNPGANNEGDASLAGRLNEAGGNHGDPVARNGLWFMLGSIGGFTVLLLEAFVIEPLLYRGKRISTNPLGGAQYDRDQFPIDVTVGLAMVVAGWILGVALIKLGAPRWLGIGVIVTATGIGIVFPF